MTLPKMEEDLKQNGGVYTPKHHGRHIRNSWVIQYSLTDLMRVHNYALLNDNCVQLYLFSAASLATLAKLLLDPKCDGGKKNVMVFC